MAPAPTVAPAAYADDATPKAMKSPFPLPYLIAEPVASSDPAPNPVSGAVDIDVRRFIQENYTPHLGDGAFLSGPTERSVSMWKDCESLLKTEREKNGCLDADPSTPSTITSHKPGFINSDDNVIVGLQTDAPLRRAIKPKGGFNMVRSALKAHGYPVDPKVEEIYTKHRKTHNDAVFDMYTPEMRAARSNHIITGLPDGYGRGRIIGDYRRVALYGIDKLVEAKEKDKLGMTGSGVLNDQILRMREELSEQIRALRSLQKMAQDYGSDISKPAQNAREAVQWTYFGYLSSVKEQDGAAMSIGRIDAFLDIFIQRDLDAGKITEKEAQELIDQLVIKLRLVRHLRTKEYDELFAGDPTWVTAALGGIGVDGRPLVTKTTFRLLHSLRNLGPAPEPNMTVLWSAKLPEKFRQFCAKVSIDTSSIQYESDEHMRPLFGDDYAIACCVSAMRVGKDMQFFGARCNLAKLMLYVLNRGKDETTTKQVSPDWGPMPLAEGDDSPIPFDWFVDTFDTAMDWLASLYVNTMNVIHYAHDRYCYESAQMALHDTKVRRLMAFGIAGLSIVADSLSAIKYAKVYPVRDPKTGLTVDFRIEGDFPKYGNDDDRVDVFAKQIPMTFWEKLKKTPTYRGAEHTLSILTITSNVVYGKATGATPDGRKAREPFAPGANPMHGREVCGALGSLNSIAKVPYSPCCLDGVSNTFSIVPQSLGKTSEERVDNLVSVMDGYFINKGFHINVNVFTKETLLDAMEHPENYPNLTIRVSGYAVHFARLTPEQQREVIARTFHGSL